MEKTAVITGASSGIGAACATELFKNGYNVAVCYKNGELAAKNICSSLNNSIENQGKNRAVAFFVDVESEESVNDMASAAFAEFGAINSLINSAGIAYFNLFTSTSYADWRKVIDVNLTGTFLCCKAFLPHMISKKSGQIINISSVWGEVGASCEVAYSAAKAGIIGLTKALAKEEGPSGITVNCIAPGVIQTPMISNLSENDKAALADETPLCRLGTAEEVACAAAFLLSDGAKFITGQVLGVNGGFVV